MDLNIDASYGETQTANYPIRLDGLAWGEK